MSAGDDEKDQDENKHDDDDETMIRGTNAALTAWAEATPTEQQQATVDAYAEHGEIDLELAGIDAETAYLVEHAFVTQTGKEVAKHGLDFDTWMAVTHPDDLPKLRRAVIKGDWGTVHHHVGRVTQHLQAQGWKPGWKKS